MKHYIAGLVIAVSLAIPAAASSREPMTFDFASAVSIDYWARRDVTVPCHAQQRVYAYDEIADQEDDLRGFDMFADLSTCTVDVMPWAALDATSDNVERANYCFEIAHEIGHIAGLQHPDYAALTAEQREFVTGTVMDAWGEYPFGCVHPRQWKVLQGWRLPPGWVRRSPHRVRRLWLTGHVWRARSARQAWLKAERRLSR